MTGHWKSVAWAACTGLALSTAVWVQRAAAEPIPDPSEPAAPIKRAADSAAADADIVIDPTFVELPISAPPAPGTATRPRTLRAGPPPGGSCQAIGPITTSPFTTPALTGALGTTGNTARYFDNFRTPDGAAPIPVTTIRWTTIQRIGTGAAATAPFSEGAALTSFNVAIFADAGGFPSSTAVVANSVVTIANGRLTSTPNTTYGIASGNATGVAPATLFGHDYTATLPAGSTLEPGRCYWVNIWHSTTPTAGTVYFATSPDGDGMCWQRTSGNPTPTAGAVPIFGDIHFCLDIPTLSVGNGVTCPLATTMTCYVPTPSPNPQPAGNANCQVYDINGGGTNSSLAANVLTADNFRVATTSTLSGGCFQGFYGGTATIPTAAEDAFRIRILADSAMFPGVPDTSAPVLEVTVGAGGSGGTLSRISAGAFTTRGQSWAWTLDTPLSLPPGNYWLEVAYANSNWGAEAWNWYTKANDRPLTIADAFRQSKGAGSVDYGRNTQNFAIDHAWCLSLGAGETLSKPTNRDSRLNNQCQSAIPLTLGSTVFGNTIDGLASAIIPPACGSVYTNGAGVWYTVTGNGETITLTTCGSGPQPNVPNTTFDTVLLVYCPQSATANPCDGPFGCVASNNDDANCTLPGPTRSTVSFPSVSGQTYYVYLTDRRTPNGGATATGYYYLTATTDGVPAAGAACASISPCRIDIPAGAVAEDEPCDNLTSSNGTCNGAIGINAGQWGTGAVHNSGATREVDVWKVLNLPTSATGQWINITIRSEQPMIVRYGNGPCTTTGPLNQYFFSAGGCTAPESFNVFAPNEGDLYVVVATASFSGVTCGVGGVGNRYVLSVTPATLGACCAPGNACVTSPRDSVPVVGIFTSGAPALPSTAVACNTHATNTGNYLGDGTACNPTIDPNNANNPCEQDGSAPAASTFGRCCLPDGSCSLVAQSPVGPAPAVCANGAFTSGGVCSPNECPLLARACCSSNGACTITLPANCAGVSGSATACLPNTCAPITGECCVGSACSVTTQAVCAGTWTNGGSCTPGPCAPANVNCCRGTTCNPVTAGTCTGAVAGSASLVVSSCGTGNTIATCCYADFNHDGLQSIDDLFLYFNAYFTSSPFAKFGGDGVAQPQIDDLFLYINAYFSACL